METRLGKQSRPNDSDSCTRCVPKGGRRQLPRNTSYVPVSTRWGRVWRITSQFSVISHQFEIRNLQCPLAQFAVSLCYNARTLCDRPSGLSRWEALSQAMKIDKTKS
jgi:hypothetical protein